MALKPWSELTLVERRSIRKAFIRNPQKAYNRFCVSEDNSSEQSSTPSTPETPVNQGNSGTSETPETPTPTPTPPENNETTETPEQSGDSGNTVTVTIEDTSNSNLNLQAYLSTDGTVGELTPVTVSNSSVVFSNVENGDYYIILEDADTSELFYAVESIQVDGDETVTITLREITVSYQNPSMETMSFTGSLDIMDYGNTLALQQLEGQQSIILADGGYMINNETYYTGESTTAITVTIND